VERIERLGQPGVKSRGKEKSGMVIATLVTGVLALVLLCIGYSHGNGDHLTGMRVGMKMFLQVTPLLIFAFLAIGMLPLILPREVVVKWVGEEAGLRGIMIGAFAGGVAPGGPMVQSIMAAGLYKSGAAVGTVVSFLTAGTLWGLTRLPVELGVLGWRLTLIRLASTFFFPPIAGWIAQHFFGGVK
jgi:uncharacterized membrane protein YraQ (UPF0718 family)